MSRKYCKTLWAAEFVRALHRQLYPVVAHGMESEIKINNFFNLYEQLYVGDTTKRLLTQRWTGPYKSAMVVKNKKEEILQILEIVANLEKASVDVLVKAAGLLNKV